jgi:ribonucleoside-diphosphate reductase alpha chain
MMAAAQPFLSGAISKTVNMPSDVTPDDISDAYYWGWELGLKALAIYRDGSKQSQPLNTSSEEDKADAKAAIANRPRRKRLPDTRQSVTHKFDISGHTGYITCGLYENGQPGEVFITMAKEGSTIGGVMDAFGTSVSLSLQYGVPLYDLVDKFSYSRFEPMGPTRNPDIRMAKSVVDYIFRWLGMQFIPGYREEQLGVAYQEVSSEEENSAAAVLPKPSTNGEANNGVAVGESVFGEQQQEFARLRGDAPACDGCGSITVRNGNCYLCHNCGSSMGCS